MSEEPTKPKIVFDNYACTIVSVKDQMDNLRIIQFRLDDKKIDFIAGQYVSVILEGVRPAPFSIASSPILHNTIELGIEITGGPVTSKIKQAVVGDKAVLRGPFGTFVLKDEKKVCFLAGGVGITPFMSMLRWMRDTNQDIHATLIYSCRQEQQFLWIKELEEMTHICPNIKIVLTCTRETPADWKHHLGRIDEKMVKEVLPDFMENTFYSCGPPVLIDAMFDLLKKMGVPENQCKKEDW